MSIVTACAVSVVKRMRVAGSVGSTGPGRTTLKGRVSINESSRVAAGAPVLDGRVVVAGALGVGAR